MFLVRDAFVDAVQRLKFVIESDLARSSSVLSLFIAQPLKLQMAVVNGLKIEAILCYAIRRIKLHVMRK